MDASFVWGRLLAAAAVSVLLSAGCGGGDDDSTSAASGASGLAGATGEAGAASEQVPLDGPPDPALTVAEIVPSLPLPDAVVDEGGFHETLDILIAASHKY